MEALRERFSLAFGVELDGERWMAGELRPATLADAYAAAAAVAVPDDLAKNPAAGVAYQMAIDDAQILAQVVCLSDADGSASDQRIGGLALADLIATIDPDDMAIVRLAAANLKKKRLALKRGSPPGESPSAPSSAPAFS